MFDDDHAGEHYTSGTDYSLHGNRRMVRWQVRMAYDNSPSDSGYDLRSKECLCTGIFHAERDGQGEHI